MICTASDDWIRLLVQIIISIIFYQLIALSDHLVAV